MTVICIRIRLLSSCTLAAQDRQTKDRCLKVSGVVWCLLPVCQRWQSFCQHCIKSSGLSGSLRGLDHSVKAKLLLLPERPYIELRVVSSVHCCQSSKAFWTGGRGYGTVCFLRAQWRYCWLSKMAGRAPYNFLFIKEHPLTFNLSRDYIS